MKGQKRSLQLPKVCALSQNRGKINSQMLLDHILNIRKYTKVKQQWYYVCRNYELLQNSFFKCGCPEKYLRFPCVSSIQPTGCGSDKIECQVLQPACFVNDHPNRYSVISSCDNTHLFEKNITQIQNEWKYC